MASIQYRFRSAAAFESLPLPGTTARVFDVKRAIVRAKRLDAGGSQAGSGLEFDLSIRNANTNEEYADETALLPRGTRLIVQRMPAARGHGLLARIARAEGGGGGGPVQQYGNVAAAQRGFYEVSSRHYDDDEFVRAPPAPAPAAMAAPAPADEASELAALRAVTDQAGTALTTGRTAGSLGGMTKTGFSAPGGGHGHRPPPGGHRPNADPELREAERREAQIAAAQRDFAANHHRHQQQQGGPGQMGMQQQQQQQQQPKKSGRGIPRTFLSLTKPPVTDGSDGPDGDDGEAATANQSSLQTNALGFEALLARGGGASATGPGASQRRDLRYALDLTATTVPDHLRCGICDQVAANAMLIPWDAEGRTACEPCIRDGLTQNMFKCPLTGMEGVSPDDLMPNIALRKAADLFVGGVMDKMDEVLQEQEREEEEERKKREAEEAARAAAAAAAGGGGGGGGAVGAGRGAVADLEDDAGAVVGRRGAAAAAKAARRAAREDDPFGGGGGGDDFGGDVFDVANSDDDEDNDDEQQQGGGHDEAADEQPDDADVRVGTGGTDEAKINGDSTNQGSTEVADANTNANANADKTAASEGAAAGHDPTKPPYRKLDDAVAAAAPATQDSSAAPNNNNRRDRSMSPPPQERTKKRAVPQGYQMGPAGIGETGPSPPGGPPPPSGGGGIPGPPGPPGGGYHNHGGYQQGGGRDDWNQGGRGGYNDGGGGGRFGGGRGWNQGGGYQQGGRFGGGRGYNDGGRGRGNWGGRGRFDGGRGGGRFGRGGYSDGGRGGRGDWNQRGGRGGGWVSSHTRRN